MTNPPTNPSSPKVWVGCLACYNAAHLVGDWFDATDAPTHMTAFDVEMTGHLVPDSHLHARSVDEIHEELWVFDYEGFDGLLTGECSPGHAARLAGLLTELGDLPGEVIAHWVDDGHQIDDFEDSLRDAYAGHYGSGADYAMTLADDLADNDHRALAAVWPYTCIDWDHAWRELTYSGDTYAINAPGGVYIFRGV